jgi:HPt (histidine-containing phosphotransfer) domain-containing protein
MGDAIVRTKACTKEHDMINKQKALDDFQITEKEYDELLGEFIIQADDKIVGIRQCISTGNMVEAEYHAHSLKGVAGNLRLETCYRITSLIDDVLKKNHSVGIDDLLLELVKSIDEVRSSITAQP